MSGLVYDAGVAFHTSSARASPIPLISNSQLKDQMLKVESFFFVSISCTANCYA